MPSTTTIHVRVDQSVKEGASATLAKLGISMSDAMRIMLVRVAAEKRFHLISAPPMLPLSKRSNPLVRIKASGSGP